MNPRAVGAKSTTFAIVIASACAPAAGSSARLAIPSMFVSAA
jgi:hypothetical protein